LSTDDSANKSPVVGPSKPRLWQVLGPGLITGASDDDPSGIATYSQAGAQYGYGLGWTLVLTYPLMVVIQAISARIGRTTGRGIAGNLREHYPNWLLQAIVFLLSIANTLNLGADLGAMGEASKLLLPGIPTPVYIVFFGIVCTAGQIAFKHTRYVAFLKWLSLSLFSYFAAMCAVHISWIQLLKGLVWPSLDPGSPILAHGRRRFRHDDQSVSVFLASRAGSRRYKGSPSAQAASSRADTGSDRLSTNPARHAHWDGIF
jgi:Mn2+/Fe2+ NRAMP family transporter